MPRRTILSTVLAAVLCLISTSAADAQLRIFRDRRDSRSESPVNPAHEDSKRSAETAYQNGDYQKAVDLTSQVISENPTDHVAYYLRGSAKVDLGLQRGDRKLIREGIADAREAIRVDPKRSAIYYLPYLYGMKSLATMENRKEHAEIAVKVAEQALGIPNLKPDEKANLLYQRAMSQAFLKKYDEAITDCQEALKLQPSHLGAVVVLAETQAAAGKKEDALASYGKAIEQFPNNPLVYNNRGMYLQQVGRNDEAINDFTRAIEINPQYYYSYTNRGFSLLQTENAQAAEADFTASLRINENQSYVYNLRGQSRLAQGNVAGAIEDHNRIIQMQPQDPVAQADLGFTHFFTGEYAKSLEAFDKAVSLGSQLRYLDPWRYWCLVALNKGDEGKTRFAEALAKEAAKRDWIDRLLAYVSGGTSEADLLASVDSKDERMKNDQTCEAEFFIGLRAAKEGKDQEAAAHFQKAINTGSKHLSGYRGAKMALKKSGGATPAAAANTPAKSG